MKGGNFARLREDLMILTKARLSLLVVSTAVFGYLIAAKSAGGFSWAILFHVSFGTALAAFGASVYNQLMEIETDAKMDRTSGRPLPAGRFSKILAFVIGWVACAFGIVHLEAMVNTAASFLAGATLLIYLFAYTPLKRRSSFNTIIGAISGAIPPLIGWVGGGGALLSWGTAYLFGLLFFWQLPHFVAINWLYRGDYENGGFVMWSNGDESGNRTAFLLVLFSTAVLVFGALMGFTGIQSAIGVAGGIILGLVMVFLAFRFWKRKSRKAARILFFYTLIYLPVAMAVSYATWSSQ